MTMRPATLACLTALLWATAAAIPQHAAAQTLPLPSAGLPGYLNGAQQVPDPALSYKVVFDISSAGSSDRIHPGLARAVLYLNTLAEYGVAPIHRKLTILLHGDATQFALQNAVYATRNHGHPNPNAALIEALQHEGVLIRVCGQGLLAEHLAPRDVLPAVQVDLWALSTRVNLQLHGYVAIEE